MGSEKNAERAESKSQTAGLTEVISFLPHELGTFDFKGKFQEPTRPLILSNRSTGLIDAPQYLQTVCFPASGMWRGPEQ